MSVYVNMHNANRLTLKEAQALWDAADRGVMEMEDAVDDCDGVVTQGTVNAAIRAKDKLMRCMVAAERRAEKKAKQKKEKRRAQAE